MGWWGREVPPEQLPMLGSRGAAGPQCWRQTRKGGWEARAGFKACALDAGVL